MVIYSLIYWGRHGFDSRIHSHLLTNSTFIIMSIRDLIASYQETQSVNWKTRRRNELISRKEEFITYFNNLSSTEEQSLKVTLPFMFN